MQAPELSQDVYRAHLQSVIAGLRYWIPSVWDAARVEESESAGMWKMTVAPLVSGACPLELLLRDEGKFDIMLANEIYEDLPMLPFEDFLPLVQSVAEGRIIQRRWLSPVTGAVRDLETIVELGNGRYWRGTRLAAGQSAASLREGAELRDRVFLPYRREHG